MANKPTKPQPCKAIKRLLNDKQLTIIGLSRCVGRSNVSVHKYLHNPYLMTLGQLISIAGYLSMPPAELFVILHLNRSLPDVEIKQMLSDITAKVEREENK